MIGNLRDAFDFFISDISESGKTKNQKSKIVKLELIVIVKSGEYDNSTKGGKEYYPRISTIQYLG